MEPSNRISEACSWTHAGFLKAELLLDQSTTRGKVPDSKVFWGPRSLRIEAVNPRLLDGLWVQ